MFGFTLKIAKMEISKLIGKTLVDISNLNDEGLIFTEQNCTQYKMYHNQDCCESVSIDDIEGDLKDLINHPILQAEEVSNSENPKFMEWPDEDEPNGVYKSYDESCTWTFYKLATVKGYVTIKWYGSSNGYYSEGVDFVQIGTEDEYGFYPD